MWAASSSPHASGPTRSPTCWCAWPPATSSSPAQPSTSATSALRARLPSGRWRRWSPADYCWLIATDERESAEWRRILTEGHRPLVLSRHVFRHLPSDPRCKVCGNPFGGVGGRALRLAGFTPSRKNPNLCARCCDSLPPGGAEGGIAVLFADVRGSTTLGAGGAAGGRAPRRNRLFAP